ncbi:hypothetical protein [Gorillibacterium sp. CAU 1737]|uniref:hypothetical protein n=1 Tax=Gorillibacterium sp. CAU 1737 TaxID=3140362 RepID=UPI0032604C2F
MTNQAATEQGTEKLLIKHGVGGRTFVDSSQDPEIQYRVEPDGEGWLFTIGIAPSSAVVQILEWRQELNVFLFRDYPNRPTVKCWYYVLNGPVEYHRDREELVIRADSRIEYVPDEF